MKIQPAVKKETGHVALGVLVGDGVMILVFALLEKLDYTVWLGALLGSVFAVFSFFLLGLTVQNVVESGMSKENAARYMKGRYNMRMLMMLAVIIVGFRVDHFHVIAVIVPFLLPQATVVVFRRAMIKKENQSSSSEKERGEKQA